MPTLLVTDELWSLVEPLLPRHAPGPEGGHPRVGDRVCLTGILFVLKTGIPWEDFPQEMGCCGMTLWNRLDAWCKAGVWPTLHRLLLDRLRGAERIDFSRVVVDPASVRAVHREKGTGPRGPPQVRSNHHQAAAANGVPLACILTAANRHDVTQLLPLVDAIPPVRGKVGAPLRKPGAVMGDRAYHDERRRMILSGRGVPAAIARRTA